MFEDEDRTPCEICGQPCLYGSRHRQCYDRMKAAATVPQRGKFSDQEYGIKLAAWARENPDLVRMLTTPGPTQLPECQ